MFISLQDQGIYFIPACPPPFEVVRNSHVNGNEKWEVIYDHGQNLSANLSDEWDVVDGFNPKR